MNDPFNQAAQDDPAVETLRALRIPFERRADGSLFVPGNIDLSERDLTALPDLSNVHVGGDFWCYNNQLVSLKGAPASIGGEFMCDGNQLASLRDGPAIVGGNYWAYRNPFTDINGVSATGGVITTDFGDFDGKIHHATVLQRPLARMAPVRFNSKRPQKTQQAPA